MAFNSSGTFSSDGSVLKATYTQLGYQIIGYNGTADFSASEPLLNASNITTLESGSLLDGQLTLSFLTGDIVGHVHASIDEARPQFVVGPLSGFEFDVEHVPGQYVFTAPTIQVKTNSGIKGQLNFGRGHSKQAAAQLTTLAAFAPADLATAGPEPASFALLGTGLLGIGVLTRRGRASASHPFRSIGAGMTRSRRAMCSRERARRHQWGRGSGRNTSAASGRGQRLKPSGNRSQIHALLARNPPSRLRTAPLGLCRPRRD